MDEKTGNMSEAKAAVMAKQIVDLVESGVSLEEALDLTMGPVETKEE